MAVCPPNVDLLAFERSLQHRGYRFLAGIDEAGRGPLAGPVVAACVVMEAGAFANIPGVYDSKTLTPRQRFVLYEQICALSLAWGVGIVDSERIDTINIYRATQEAMQTAFQACQTKIDAVLVDAMPLDLGCFVSSIVKGDQKSFLIAAASIVAKVSRDRIMDDLHLRYPHYQWNQNRGYPTKKHREAIHAYGLSPFHRQSFDCYGGHSPGIFPQDKTHAE